MTAKRIHLVGASGSGTTTLGRALAQHLGCPHFTGSLCGWGDVYIPRFDQVVFCLAAPEMRLARLHARERERYGAAIDPGGPLRAKYEAFIAWAASYEHGSPVERNRRMHEDWLAKLPCPVLRLDDADDVETRVKTVTAVLSRRCPS